MEITRQQVESREAERGRRPEMASRANKEHPDRNEDALLGDVGRIDAEGGKEVALRTNDQATDRAAIRRFSEIERKSADALREREVYGAFDGVSGSTETGSGHIASRIAAGVIADRLTCIPADADAETYRKGIEEAMQMAHEEILRHKYDRSDLEQMSTTADVAKKIEHEDGSAEIAYGHAGDSRIYILDGESGELRSETVDDGPVGDELRAGRITREEYEQVSDAEKMDDLPEKLRMFFRFRSSLDEKRLLGGSEQVTVTTGVIKAKRGDRIIVTTDGLHENIKKEKLIELLRASKGAAELAEYAAANGKKADDISLNVIDVGEFAPKPEWSANAAETSRVDRLIADTLEKAGVARDLSKAEQARRTEEQIGQIISNLESIYDGHRADKPAEAKDVAPTMPGLFGKLFKRK